MAEGSVGLFNDLLKRTLASFTWTSLHPRRRVSVKGIECGKNTETLGPVSVGGPVGQSWGL